MDDRCEDEEEDESFLLLSAFILVEGCCKFGSSLIEVVVLVGGNKVGAKSTLVSSLACTLESSVVVLDPDVLVLEDLSFFKMPPTPKGSTPSFFNIFKAFFVKMSNSLVVEETPESKSSLSRDLLEQRLIGSGWVELSGDTLAEEILSFRMLIT